MLALSNKEVLQKSDIYRTLRIIGVVCVAPSWTCCSNAHVEEEVLRPSTKRKRTTPVAVPGTTHTRLLAHLRAPCLTPAGAAGAARSSWRGSWRVHAPCHPQGALHPTWATWRPGSEKQEPRSWVRAGAHSGGRGLRVSGPRVPDKDGRKPESRGGRLLSPPRQLRVGQWFPRLPVL